MPNNPEAIVAVVTQLLPEAMAFVRSFHNRNNELPTDEQVIQHMNLNAARVISISDKWLAEHPE